MNKFSNLAKKLISNSLWSSTITIKELIQTTNLQNRAIFTPKRILENIKRTL